MCHWCSAVILVQWLLELFYLQVQVLNQVQHPEKLELERAKVIMKQIFLFPFMWKSAEFQDLNRKKYAFLEIIQKSSTDVHCHRRNILDA